MAGNIQPFTELRFQTSTGENCVAIKNGNTVTIKGDQKGLRQLEMEEFKKFLIEDQTKKQLERTPQDDTFVKNTEN